MWGTLIKSRRLRGRDYRSFEWQEVSEIDEKCLLKNKQMLAEQMTRLQGIKSRTKEIPHTKRSGEEHTQVQRVTSTGEANGVDLPPIVLDKYEIS